MDYPRLRALLADSEYMRELLNDGGVLRDDREVNHHILKGWINEEASECITEKYRDLCGQDGTFLNVVKVVHDPEVPYDAVAVEHNADRCRYILITVLPDVDATYALNFPILQTMGVTALSSWEMARITTLAAQYMAEVKIAKEPMPPILNNAIVQWVSICVGKQEYNGGHSMLSSYATDIEDPWDFDIHLFEARKMENNTFMEKLVAAYDADCAETGQN